MTLALTFTQQKQKMEINISRKIFLSTIVHVYKNTSISSREMKIFISAFVKIMAMNARTIHTKLYLTSYDLIKTTKKISAQLAVKLLIVKRFAKIKITFVQ